MTHEHTHSAALWRIICKSMIAAIVALGITTTHATASEARFIPLPKDFVPFEMSGDGSVVVGQSLFPQDCFACSEAALWTEASGLELLGLLREGHYTSRGFDVSADGSVIVGSSGFPREAFRWTRESGMVGLGYLPGAEGSGAVGVSGDGSVVVGASGSGGGPEAYRWTEDEGMVGIGADLAYAVSWNGSVIAGDLGTGTPFRWTTETGLTDLGRLPGIDGWPPNDNLAMSVNGRLIVGSAKTADGLDREPLQWTGAGGIERLPNWDLTFPWGREWPYPRSVNVRDMSDDGTYVVGNYHVQKGPDTTDFDIVGSFIWDEERGFRDLHDLLVNEYGLASEMANWSEDWNLDGAMAMSYDGRRIVGVSSMQGCVSRPSDCGYGGWMVVLGPPFQPGDANRDEVFNSTDLVQVFQVGEYEDGVAGNSLWKDGDWNLDGDFTSSDLVAAFEAGGYEQDPQEAVNAVPEPASVLLLMAGIIGFAMWRTRFAGAGETTTRHHCWSAQRRICKAMIASIVVLGISTTQATASEARFIPLPPEFTPGGISFDGSVVVGNTVSPPGCYDGVTDRGSKYCSSEAALWTEAGGVERLGLLPDADRSDARDVSADGSVIVGGSTSGDPWEAFRWTRESGMVGLGDLPGGRSSHAWGVSGDGSVVVGYSVVDSGVWETKGFRWSEESGMVGMGDSARRASWNGSVIFGANYPDAFRWTSETGLTNIGRIPGLGNGLVAMSVDGRLIVGSQGDDPRQWTEAGGIEMLPNSTFPWLNDAGPRESEVDVFDMSDDGTYVVGRYRVQDGPGTANADIVGSFIWDEEHGFRDLHDLLVNDYGLATEMADWTAEWSLNKVTARKISDDGRRIVGTSYRQGGCLQWWNCPRRSWMAILGPPYQPGDANRDDLFNSSDLVQVFQAGQYEDDVAGNSLWKDGDWNLDGDFTSSDLVAAFEAGGYEQGEPAAVNAVPEPSAASLFATGLCGLLPIWFFSRRR